MRTTIVASLVPILLGTAALLLFGRWNIFRGVRGDYESPHLYLVLDLIATSLGLLLAAVSATIAVAGNRRGHS